jgi:hypothetical protein
MKAPKRIVVEYDDGTRREALFEKLSKQAQMELSNVGLSDALSMEAPMSYLLLQWKDGWKEVVAVDGHPIDLLRYYTIERVEQVGRLSLDTADDVPELLLIKRLPDQVESILFVGREGPQAYALEEKVAAREGGKIEHIFYDKKRPNFSPEEASAASARYRVLLDALGVELQKKGLNGSELLAMAEGKRTPVYKELARALGLRGTERQRDVYGFLEAAMKKLDATSIAD